MTTPAPTTIKAAVAYILTHVTSVVTQTGGHTLYIGYGEPSASDADDQIYLGDIDAENSLIGMRTPTTANPLSETFGIPFLISAFRANDNGQKAFERSVDMINALVGVVRTDPTLGGAVLDAYPRRVLYPSPGLAESGQGRVAETELIIDVLGTN